MVIANSRSRLPATSILTKYARTALASWHPINSYLFYSGNANNIKYPKPLDTIIAAEACDRNEEAFRRWLGCPGFGYTNLVNGHPNKWHTVCETVTSKSVKGVPQRSIVIRIHLMLASRFSFKYTADRSLLIFTDINFPAAIQMPLVFIYYSLCVFRSLAAAMVNDAKGNMVREKPST